ncbi:MAG TPA: hypothetical protein VF676_00255 [Flavobacterium sp.]
MKRNLKIFGIITGVAIAGFITLLYCGIIWRSPAYYTLGQHHSFAVPIMDMAAYDTLGNHPRPYIFEVGHGDGIAYILGIEHTKDENNGQINIIRATWETVNPEVAFVEGRLGFLFSGLQDPVEKYGEGGATVSLAKRDRIPYFTWEPRREDEVKMVLQKFSPKQAAAFYALRPYLSNFRFAKPEDPDAAMLEFIHSRTDVDRIRNTITSVAQIDSLWQTDFPGEKDWRDSSDQYGWPKGWLSDIASYSNNVRDIHLCNAIIEEVGKGKTVFVTMGSSHAFRIEKTLRHEMRQDAALQSRYKPGKIRPDNRMKRRCPIGFF